MSTLHQKLTERATLTNQMTELAERAAQLDAEIQELYEAEHPKQPDSEFIMQARIDCERILKTLSGKPQAVLMMLLDSPLGFVKYGDMIQRVWPDYLPQRETIRNTFSYLTRCLKNETGRYVVHAHISGFVRLDVVKVPRHLSR